jgi:hypothetical protein
VSAFWSWQQHLSFSQSGALLITALVTLCLICRGAAGRPPRPERRRRRMFYL